jgi:beta-lactamase regulating signal transducer with metallopeptidase domain
MAMSLLQMSISAGMLILAIVLIRVVALNRLPKIALLMLWGVALFRLLVPLSLPAPFSVQFSFYSAIREAAGAVSPDNATMPMFEGMLIFGDTTAGMIGETAQVQTANISPITIIWLFGMFAVIIFFAVVYFKSHRALRFAIPIRDNEFLNEWLAKHRLLRPIAIMCSDRIATPLAVGLIKPRIILPKSMNMNDRQLLSHVLLHEYYHIKRFDALWKILMVAALCVHWFNPLVWVMFILASRDLELTCDEMVLNHFGAGTRKTYAFSIIGMAEQRSKFASLHNGFSKNAAKKIMKERIESIMKTKKASLGGMILAFAMVAALSIGALTAFATDTTASDYADNPAVTEFSAEARERMAAIVEEAGIVIMPYELRALMPVPALDEGETTFFSPEEMHPDIRAWQYEQLALGVSFIMFDPMDLLRDPEIYALVMEGANWGEIMDFMWDRAIERLESQGHSVRRFGNVRRLEIVRIESVPFDSLDFIPANETVARLFEAIREWAETTDFSTGFSAFVIPEDIDINELTIIRIDELLEGREGFILNPAPHLRFAPNR